MRRPLGQDRPLGLDTSHEPIRITVSGMVPFANANHEVPGRLSHGPHRQLLHVAERWDEYGVWIEFNPAPARYFGEPNAPGFPLWNRPFLLKVL